MVEVDAMTTSKSPLRVLLTAFEVGKSALRPYAHRFSPKKFTQPQLFACLVLKEFLKLDYRGLSMLLKALESAGLSAKEAADLAAQAARQRAAYGLAEEALVPNIPRRLPQTKP